MSNDLEGTKAMMSTRNLILHECDMRNPRGSDTALLPSFYYSECHPGCHLMNAAEALIDNITNEALQLRKKVSADSAECGMLRGQLKVAANLYNEADAERLGLRADVLRLSADIRHLVNTEIDDAALTHAEQGGASLEASVPPLDGPKAVPLTRDCAPGQFVFWTDVQGWTYTGTIKEWDNGTAIIMWPMIQTPLIAVRG